MLPFLALLIGCVITILIFTHRPTKLVESPFYINLEHRIDRKIHCERTLKRAFKNPIRFDAVEGSALPTPLNDKRIHQFYDTKENQRWDRSIEWIRSHRMSQGEIGCCLSHRNLWEYAMNASLHQVIIFEDDVVLYDNFVRNFRLACDELPSDWDILYLGYIDVGGLGNLVSSHLRTVKFVFGAYAYMLSEKGLKKIISQLPIDRPLDNFLGYLTEHEILRGYAVYPPIANQIEYGGKGSNISHSAHLI